MECCLRRELPQCAASNLALSGGIFLDLEGGEVGGGVNSECRVQTYPARVGPDGVIVVTFGIP